MKTFKELQLPLPLERALQALAFETPTEIQAQAIPVALSRQDLIASAQTGTGKTAAFCIPIAVRLLRAPGKSALVLAPTRELALQIEAFWVAFTKFAPELKCVSLIGGMAMPNQVKGIRNGARLIVATPGRLVDHLSRGTVSLSKVEILVLDEADRMLDMGFAPQLTQILRFLPKARQTLMFSATLPPDIDRLSSKYLKSPIRVSAGQENQAAPKVTQTAIVLNAVNKNNTLLDELNQREGSVLVFARTQARTDRVARYLSGFGLEVNRIHGGRSQGQRKQALTGFKSGKVRILVATDIAARGIDVTGIAHVINYDLPMAAEDYIHRIGRTARAGASGHALSLVTPEDRSQWREITKLLQKSGSSMPEEREGNQCRS